MEQEKMPSLRRLTREEILAIPQMKRDGMSHKEIAERYSVGHETIVYWVKRLRGEGFEVPNLPPIGRKPMKLRE